jgi:dynein heavy chain 1
MAEVMNMYQEKVGDLVEILDDIEVELSALDKCQYSAAAVTQILQSIQKSVDQLVLNNYSNLKNYLQNLDSTV